MSLLPLADRNAASSTIGYHSNSRATCSVMATCGRLKAGYRSARQLFSMLRTIVLCFLPSSADSKRKKYYELVIRTI